MTFTITEKESDYLLGFYDRDMDEYIRLLSVLMDRVAKGDIDQGKHKQALINKQLMADELNKMRTLKTIGSIPKGNGINF